MGKVVLERKDVPEEVLENFNCLFPDGRFMENTTVDYYPNGFKNTNEDQEVNRYTALKGGMYGKETFWVN